MDAALNRNSGQDKSLKVLWICSWFPHERDPYDGDFILRHAQAAALYQHIDVLHIVQQPSLLLNKTIRKQINYDHQLSATIVYPPYFHHLPALLRKVFFNISYYYLLRREVNKYVLKNGTPDLVHVHVPAKSGWAARMMKRTWKVPYIVTEHSSAYTQSVPDGYFYRGLFFRYQTRKTFEKADLVLSVSFWLLNHLKKQFPIRKLMLVRNVVDTASFYPISRKRDKIRLIHVSMMQPLKHLKGILDALALLSQQRNDWEIVFVGPASSELKKYAHDRGLDSFLQWKGLITYKQVAHEMQEADGYIHFSRYENLPCVIQEALCCGLFVISSDVGGIAELVNERNGILVKEGDINGLKTAMNNLIEHIDRVDKHQIAGSYHEQWSFSQIGQELDSIYRSVLSKNID